jgi:hypothetical protein
MKREMELELQLQEAQTAYGMLFDQKVSARTTVIANAFSEFIAPENTRLSAREKSVEFDLMEDRYANTLARLEIRDAYDDDYRKTGYEGAYRFNSGGDKEIKFLPAMAEFIKIASDKVDKICKLFVDIDQSFGPKLTEARKVRDGIQRELNEIDNARQQAKKDAILDLMKSEEGFVPLSAKPNKEYGWNQTTSLQMKFNWEVKSPALIKVVGQSASGKSVKVLVSINRYDNSMFTYELETIRMENLQSFINREVFFRDRVESELEGFEIVQGLLL